MTIGLYSADLPAAFAFRHLALAAADNAARAAALNRFLRLTGGLADPACPFALAHLFARAWARAVNAAWVMVLRFLRPLPGGRPGRGATVTSPGPAEPPTIVLSSLVNASICSRRPTARRSCASDKSDNAFAIMLSFRTKDGGKSMLRCCEYDYEGAAARLNSVAIHSTESL